MRWLRGEGEEEDLLAMWRGREEKNASAGELWVRRRVVGWLGGCWGGEGGEGSRARYSGSGEMLISLSTWGGRGATAAALQGTSEV